MSDERKYRHRGYQQESGGDREARRPNAPPPPKKEGPRGRGFGAPTESVFRCAVCGGKRLIAEVIEPATTCSKCGADLHTCANCVHFDPGVRFECRRFEELPARIGKKRDRNDCALFDPKTVTEFAQEQAASGGGKPSDARSAFDALFKNI